jgi:hypothetical protein
MGGTCSTHGIHEKCIQNCCWGNLKGRGDSEDVGVDGMIILELTLLK